VIANKGEAHVTGLANEVEQEKKANPVALVVPLGALVSILPRIALSPSPTVCASTGGSVS
jgi:hypothetical protein